MLPDFAALEGRYLQDILDQPRALQDTQQGLNESAEMKRLAVRLKRGKFQRIVLTGMGASFHALHPLRLELIGHGSPAVMAETSELVHYESQWLDAKSLLVVVSQSGRSAEVIRLLRMNRGRVPVIAVTNTPDSPLAKRADAVVLTSAGSEFSVSCKTYVTALLALKWVSAILCGADLGRTRRELKKAAGAVERYLSDWKSHVTALARWFQGLEYLFLVGRGPSLAAVGAGALIIKESDRVHAEGMSSAAFRHGPFEMLRRGVFVLVFSGEAKTRALNRSLLVDIRKHGALAEAVGDDSELSAFRLPVVPRGPRPLLEILSAQMVTLALAANAGRTPGEFALVSKVTSTE